LIAAAQAGNIADGNILLVGAFEGGVESGPDLVASAKMAGHVGAHTHVDFRGRAEVKMGIEAGYGVDLTDRNIDFCGERLEPVGWQIPEIFLYGPQLFKHDSGRSAQDLREVKTLHKMARSHMLQQNGFHVYT
jgi:hypothetical protein